MVATSERSKQGNARSTTTHRMHTLTRAGLVRPCCINHACSPTLKNMMRRAAASDVGDMEQFVV
jgi:hypothetical protein